MYLHPYHGYEHHELMAYEYFCWGFIFFVDLNISMMECGRNKTKISKIIKTIEMPIKIMTSAQTNNDNKISAK